MAIGFFELLIILVVVVSVFVLLPIWIWALVDCLKHESSEGNEKLIWILTILLGGIIGAVLYVAIARRRRIEAERS